MSVSEKWNVTYRVVIHTAY